MNEDDDFYYNDCPCEQVKEACRKPPACCCTGPRGPRGFRGPTGQRGPLPQIEIRDTITLDPGSPASVSSSHTAEGIALEFGIPKGEPGMPFNIAFASYVNYAASLPNGQLLPFAPIVEDETAQITQTSPSSLHLMSGYYLISYHVSALLNPQGYLQVTPSYNGSAHIETGIYFMNAAANTSAYGSNTIIIRVPTTTSFTLNFNTNVRAIEGTLTLSLVKLKDLTT